MGSRMSADWTSRGRRKDFSYPIYSNNITHLTFSVLASSALSNTGHCYTRAHRWIWKGPSWVLWWYIDLHTGRHSDPFSHSGWSAKGVMAKWSRLTQPHSDARLIFVQLSVLLMNVSGGGRQMLSNAPSQGTAEARPRTPLALPGTQVVWLSQSRTKQLCCFPSAYTDSC